MPTESEMAAAGFVPEDYEADIIEVWPEHHAALKLFASLSTQWRFGAMGGATGLDYSSLYPLLDRMNLAEAEWQELFSDVQVMEQEAMSVMNAKD